MKGAATLLVLALAPAWPQVSKPGAVTAARAAPAPQAALNPAKPMRIAPQAFTDLERRFDTKLSAIGNVNDPLDLLGATRGLYLDGYGAVFTTELSLIVTPSINPWRQQITKEEAARVHQRKLDRVAPLRQAMKDMVKTSAMTLTQIPDNQQIVVVVRLLYLPWEDTTGMVGQILMKADRKAALAGDIKTEEQ